MLLSGKVVFVTGGSTGIGFACAAAYANEGAQVVIAALDEEDSKKAAVKLGDKHLGFACDVTNPEQVEAAFAKTISKFGRIDIIHNNAGIATPSKSLHDTTDSEWTSLVNVNLRSILLTTRYGFPHIKISKGNILNTSSMVGIIGQENHALYSATKGALNALTKSMALDYAKYGVRVNAICPAGVWTPMLRQWAAEQSDPPSISNYLNTIHPLGYCPEGNVVADAAVFLVSEKARFITGHLLHVSGGAELGYRRH
jgi:meso-butanediol dehydrogenase / (S,S)-butanediol dehydrogenase / diacetyl reductase